jgi:RNA polymerase sigma factor (sigma-70 family)
VALFRSSGQSASGPLDRDDEFRRFASRFLPTLLKGAYLLLHDIDLAEDVVQGTMLRVFMHWENARAAPEAYSRKTLINVCRDYWRRRDPGLHELRLGLREAQATESEIGGQVRSFTDEVAEHDAIVRALQALPERQRDVLTLRFFFDLSIEQVAELLEIPEGTVKSAASRGAKRLHEELRPPQAELNEC